MSIGQRGVGSDLVAGLVDARDTPASDRFDAELDAAVRAGQLSPDAARRLRMWQRASVSELADHIRAVLPTALTALADAREAANRRVKEREDVRDTPDPASSSEAAPQSSLETPPARLLLADLVVSAPLFRPDHS